MPDANYCVSISGSGATPAFGSDILCYIAGTPTQQAVAVAYETKAAGTVVPAYGFVTVIR